MNEKNNFFLTDWIEYLTDVVLNFFKKFGRMISNKKSHDVTEISIKIIILIFLLLILKIPVDIISKLGIYIIYKFGTILREYLSIGWSFFINYSYILLSVIFTYKVFKDILTNKELNILEYDRKKDKEVKQKVFNPVLKTIRILIYILMIPLYFTLAFLFMIIGMSSALVVDGSYLISLFIMALGLILSIVSIILLITRYISSDSHKYNKFIESILIGFGVFVFGIFALWFETYHFTYRDYLPVDFKENSLNISVDIDESKDYYIDKVKYNSGIKINKIIDNSLENKIEIKGYYLETSILNYKIENVGNKTYIRIYNDVSLDANKLEKIYDSVVYSIADKTIYSFNKLKYSTINIYGSEDILNKINIED